MLGSDLEQAFGVRLSLLNIIRADDHAETVVATLTFQRHAGFDLVAAREDREIEAIRESFEETILRKPALPMDETPFEVLTEEQIIEVIDYVLVANCDAEIGADLLGQS